MCSHDRCSACAAAVEFLQELDRQMPGALPQVWGLPGTAHVDPTLVAASLWAGVMVAMVSYRVRCSAHAFQGDHLGRSTLAFMVSLGEQARAASGRPAELCVSISRCTEIVQTGAAATCDPRTATLPAALAAARYDADCAPSLTFPVIWTRCRCRQQALVPSDCIWHHIHCGVLSPSTCRPCMRGAVPIGQQLSLRSPICVRLYCREGLLLTCCIVVFLQTDSILASVWVAYMAANLQRRLALS